MGTDVDFVYNIEIRVSFHGNPTRSYRSSSPLKIIAEFHSRERHSDEEINHMLASLKQLAHKD